MFQELSHMDVVTHGRWITKPGLLACKILLSPKVYDPSIVNLARNKTSEKARSCLGRWGAKTINRTLVDVYPNRLKAAQ